jgi:hypothetical protein
MAFQETNQLIVSNIKREGMIKNPRTKCKQSKCKETALYGITKAEHCELHKQENEINLIERKCKSCHLPNILNSEGLCMYCDPNKEKRARLAKQNEVKNYLDQHGLKYISYDKRIEENKCGLERPDFVFETPSGSHIVILEVDENQHKSRAEVCECARMVNISQDYGLPTIYIRYNPDEYKTDNPLTTKRLKVLETWLKYLRELDINELKNYGYCSYIQLFFDGYKEGNVVPITITQFDKE